MRWLTRVVQLVNVKLTNREQKPPQPKRIVTRLWLIRWDIDCNFCLTCISTGDQQNVLCDRGYGQVWHLRNLRNQRNQRPPKASLTTPSGRFCPENRHFGLILIVEVNLQWRRNTRNYFLRFKSRILVYCVQSESTPNSFGRFTLNRNCLLNKPSKFSAKPSLLCRLLIRRNPGGPVGAALPYDIWSGST